MSRGSISSASHHRLVRTRPRRGGASGQVFLARWPSQRAVPHARDRIRFLTMRARLVAPVEQVVAGKSTASCAAGPGSFVSGTRPGCSTRSGSSPSPGSRLFIAKRHQRGRAWGFAQVYRSPVHLGLVSLNGIVVAPDRTGRGGLRPYTAGEGRLVSRVREYRAPGPMGGRWKRTSRARQPRSPGR